MGKRKIIVRLRILTSQYLELDGGSYHLWTGVLHLIFFSLFGWVHGKHDFFFPESNLICNVRQNEQKTSDWMQGKHAGPLQIIAKQSPSSNY